MGNISENIGTKWTGFIRQGTGLIRQRTGLIRARIETVRRWIQPVRQRIKPVHLVLIFFLIFLFLKCLLFVSRESYTSESVYKTAHSEILY